MPIRRPSTARRSPIIGYGSQGHAHALNLRESGVDVVVGLAPGSKSRALAEEAGLRVADVADAVRAADVIMIARARHRAEVGLRRGHRAEPASRPAADVRSRIQHPVRRASSPPENVDVGMVAPKGPGHLLRSVYRQGGGVPALFAVERDASGTARDRVLAYARGLGSTRAGVLETTFAEETETDLFGEQALLCGGVSALVKAAFETLVEAGYQPELAYFETMHELKLIVDLMYRGGLNFMRFSASRHRRIRRLRLGPARDRRREGGDEGRPLRHPVRLLRRALDQRVRLRWRAVQAAARSRTATTRSSRSAPSFARRCRSSIRSPSRPVRRRPPPPAPRRGVELRHDRRRTPAGGAVRARRQRPHLRHDAARR